MQAGNVDAVTGIGREASPRSCRAKGRIEKRASTGMECKRAPAHRSVTAKNGYGEQGAHVSPIRMPRSDGACPSESKLPEGHLEPFLSRPPYRRFARGQLRHLIPRFLYGRGASGRFLPYLRSNLVAPRECLSRRPKIREIAAAGLAAVCASAQPQQETRPPGRVIASFLPLGELLPVTLRTARVAPGTVRPDAGFPTVAAAAAA